MKNLKAFSSALTMLICFLTFGQDKKVTGLVSDDKGPLAGVNVVIKGTTNGVQTDMDGNYTIKVKQGETLVFSFIGMQEKSFIVGASNVMNIKMQKSDVVLEETYGYTPVGRKKSIIANQIIEVKSIEKDTKPKSEKIFKTASSSSINTKSEPLYIVDGIVMKNSQHMKLKPDSIESITILKDSTVEAFCNRNSKYGVIIIKTKKGLTKKEIRERKRLKKDNDSTSIRFKSTH